MDYEKVDAAALYNALVRSKVCPNKRCGRPDLNPVALFEDVWGCEQCHETWFLGDDAPLPTMQEPHIDPDWRE